MKRIYTWIYLNTWTLVLDMIVISLVLLMILAPSPFRGMLFYIPCCLLLAILLRQALILHGTSREKYRAFHELNEINRASFNPQSYAPYMNAPCTRRIVTLSLRELGMSSSYGMLKERYRKRFYTPARGSGFRITFFRDNRPVETDGDVHDDQRDDI